MQPQSSHPRRHRAAIAIALSALALSACRPYGPPIPGSSTPYPDHRPPGRSSVVDAIGDDRAGATRTDEGGRRAGDAAAAGAQPADASGPGDAAGLPADAPRRSPLALPTRFRSRQDSLAWAAARRHAKEDKGLRVVVSLDARTLWLLDGRDTLRVASAAIGTEKRLVHGKQSWVFETPRGVRRVKGKAEDPIWTPPLWHYVEIAQRHGVKLSVMPANGRVALGNGERLEVRDSLVGRWSPGRGWRALPLEDEIVVDGTLYVPPAGTKHRIQHGQLGPYKLDTGDGYLIHGSPDQSTIGRAATHGCIRVADEDLRFLYETVPVGTPVYIL